MNKYMLIPPSIVGGSLLFRRGVILSSITLSMALYKFRQTPRYVSVKGLAEREGAADVAVWPTKFSLATFKYTKPCIAIAKN